MWGICFAYLRPDVVGRGVGVNPYIQVFVESVLRQAQRAGVLRSAQGRRSFGDHDYWAAPVKAVFDATDYRVTRREPDIINPPQLWLTSLL